MTQEQTPQKPVLGMSIEELVAEAIRLYGIKGQPQRQFFPWWMGHAPKEELDRAIAVGNRLIQMAGDEKKKIEALPLAKDKKEADENEARIKELEDILDGKKEGVLDYPWGTKGLAGTVARSVEQAGEIKKEGVKAERRAKAEEAQAEGFDAFIERVSAFSPDVRKSIRLAQGLTEKGEPLPTIRGIVTPPPDKVEEYKSARADLAALTKTFEDASAGKTPSTQGRGWIAEFLKSGEGKKAIEQARQVGVEPAPVPSPTTQPDEPPDPDMPLGTAALDAQVPTEEIEADAGTGVQIDIGLRPGQREEKDRRDFLWEAPYRMTLEDAYRQAAYDYYQENFEGFGEMRTDPRRISDEMVAAFTEIIEEGFSSANMTQSPTDEQKMAFLEVHFLNNDIIEPEEGQQPFYPNLSLTIQEIELSKPYKQLFDQMEDTLHSISDTQGLTKRFFRDEEPTADTIRHELRKKLNLNAVAIGSVRHQWLQSLAQTLLTKMQEDEEYRAAEDIQGQWDLVIKEIEAEAMKNPDEMQAAFETFKQELKGPLNKSEIKDALRAELEKQPTYGSLPASEIEDWLETEAVRLDIIYADTYNVRTDDLKFNIKGAASRLEEEITASVTRPLDQLMEEMELTPLKALTNWLNDESNKDLQLNDKRRLLAGSDLFYDKWLDAETGLNYQDWLAAHGAEAREGITEQQALIEEGRDEKEGAKVWFLGQAIAAGKYATTASKELRQAMASKFEEYWAEVQHQLIPVEGQPPIGDAEAQDRVLKTFMAELPDSSQWQREFDDKQMRAERALRPPLPIGAAYEQATARLQERIGKDTTEADLKEIRKNRAMLEQDIFDLEADQFPYYVDGVGITQEEFEEQHQPTLDNMDATQAKNYMFSLGITTYAEEIGQKQRNLKNLKSDEGTFQSQLDQRKYDKEVSALMMDSPELSRAFASGSVEGLKTLAQNMQTPDYLVAHLLKKQQAEGHVLTESEKRFRMAAGLPLPADSWEAQKESSVERDAALIRQQMRTTQFEATGEEREFTTPDWEALGYDPMTMTRTTPLAPIGQEIIGLGTEATKIPGTDFADTPENRKVLKEQMEQGYQYKVYKPKEPEDASEDAVPGRR